MKDKRYDLNLGEWGPYNKEYMGVCNIADRLRGATFNIELFPGFFRRSVLAHNSKSDTGIKLWGANASLTRFCYRYELEWKDRIYCDVDFNITDDKQVDISCCFVNNTEYNQSLDITLCASLQLPTHKPASEVVGFYDFYRAILPEGCIYIDATDHSDINCKAKIAGDGNRIGEEMHNGASALGTVIDSYYFYDSEHFVKYDFIPLYADSLGIRYKAERDTVVIVKTNTKSYSIDLSASDKYCYAAFPITAENIDSLTVSPTGDPVDLDCLCAGVSADSVVFERIEHNLTPEKRVEESSMTLKYKDIPHGYTVKWYEGIRMQRRCHCYDIGRLLQLTVNDHASQEISGSGEGLYEALLSTPVYLAPGESEIRHFRIFKEGEEREAIYAPVSQVSANSDGGKYLFSQNMMRYNTLLNVVYPIYTRRQFIRHNTPGRFWDSLYSWDSGFIGMGLSVADFQRGFDCLNTYLVPVGDRHSPYVFHGSVVPTQVFLYKHLYDNFPEHREELISLYPMMRQYYDFYADLDKSPEQLASGLLKTWHLSYNSGGWDDYPPQHQLRDAPYSNGADYDHLNTTPVITTAFTVLISKIMKQLALGFGFEGECEYYDSVAKKYADRINSCGLWDEDSGYFSYMKHDNSGRPERIMRYKDGTNYNMGMDGVTPFIADICSKSQEIAILDNIKNGLMTDIGVGVVDKRAPYYSPYGYWNGSVWMPHQWILWKALTDRGETALAFEIASKALDIWKREVETSYCCFENFMCHNGRGSGYHHFSGLSCPISLFFAAYYTPGTVTPGFASLVDFADFNEDKSSLTLKVTALKDDISILICMKEGGAYKVNSKIERITDGAFSVKLHKGENIITVN